MNLTQSEQPLPLDELPAARVANALALLRAFRDGYAPRTYVVGAISTQPLLDLMAAGLIRATFDDTEIIAVWEVGE